MLTGGAVSGSIGGFAGLISGDRSQIALNHAEGSIAFADGVERG